MPTTGRHYVNLGNEVNERTIILPDRGQRQDVEPPVGKPGYSGPIPRDHSGSRKWRGKVGTFIAENLGHDIRKAWHIADWPPGYSLWYRKRETGKKEGDWYLYGIGGRARFESPREFSYHALWLYDEQWHKYGRCLCTLCTGVPQGEIDAKWQGIPIRDRQTSRTSNYTSNPHYSRQVEVLLDTDKSRLFVWTNLLILPLKDWKRKNEALSAQRHDELSSQKSYRVGELTWVSIPPLRPEQPKPNESIKFWPALVSEAQPRIALASNSSEGDASKILPRYKLYLLGVGTSVVVDQACILPWQALRLPISVRAKMEFPPLPTNVTPDLAELESFQPIPAQEPPSADRVATPRTYENALAPLAIGHAIAIQLANSWNACEPYTDLTKAPNPQYYQGVWYGPERLWLHDMVRLGEPRRYILDESGRENYELVGSNSASGIGSLFGQIAQIEQEHHNDYKFTARVYELVDDVITTSADEEDDPLMQPPSLSYHSAGNHTQSYQLPAAPTGFRFRQISKKGRGIRFDLPMIAGRYHSAVDESTAGMSDRLKQLLDPGQIDELHRERDEGGSTDLEDAKRDTLDTIKQARHVYGLGNVEWEKRYPIMGKELDRQKAVDEARQRAAITLYERWTFGQGRETEARRSNIQRRRDAMDED